MARLGSKRVGEDFRNDDLAEALAYLRGKGWQEPGSAFSVEDIKRNPYEVNRGILDRLVERMVAARDAQSRLDYNNLRQWVRNRRRASLKEVSGETSFSCDLSQKAYGNLLKLAKKTGRSQRSVVENLLLEGDTTLKREIKLLRDEKNRQTDRLRDRERRLKRKEEGLKREEGDLANFKKNAQPLLDLLREIGKEGDSHVVSAFKPILQALGSIGSKDGGDIMVRDITSVPKPGRVSEEERQLYHHLTMLMQAMKA